MRHPRTEPTDPACTSDSIQILCWGILFPAGMVLGITRSRFHVPLQSLTVALSLAGNSLGHHHGGRSFHMTAHAHFAGYLWWYMISQTAMGIFLKLHVLEGTVVRRGVVVAHGIVGKSFPVVGWTQMIFGCVRVLLTSSRRAGLAEEPFLACTAASPRSGSASTTTSDSAPPTSSWARPSSPTPSSSS